MLFLSVKETTDNPSVELPVVTPGNNGQTGGNVQNTGDGSTPTQTGDAGSFGFLALTVLAGAAAVVFSRKKRD